MSVTPNLGLTTYSVNNEVSNAKDVIMDICGDEGTSYAMVIDGAIGGLVSATSSVYVCTGTADTTAIANIVNDFFNNGTAMSMSLNIIGAPGIELTNNYAISITANNTRGATCYLYFPNCSVPTVSGNFLNITSSNAKLCVYGLTVQSTMYPLILSGVNNCRFINCGFYCTSSYSGINSTSSSNNYFRNCTITVAGTYSNGIILNSSSNDNIFDNCKINMLAAGAYIYCINLLSGTNNKLINCTFSGGSQSIYISSSFSGTLTLDKCVVLTDSTGVFVDNSSTNTFLRIINCDITGGTNAIYQSTAVSTVKWHIVGNEFSGLVIVDGATKDASTDTANAYCYMPAYGNRFN